MNFGATTISQADLAGANIKLMSAIAEVIVKDRSNFVALLNESGISANEKESDSVLIDKYVNGLFNRKLLLGTAILLSMSCGNSSADGLDDNEIRNNYNTMRKYYIGPTSNAGGADPVSAVAAAVEQGFKYGSVLTGKKAAKESRPYEMLDKKAQSKQAIIDAVLKQKQTELENKQKEKEIAAKSQQTTILIAAGLIGLLAVLYFVNKKREKWTN